MNNYLRKKSGTICIELCKYCAIPVDTRKKFKWRKIQESENDWVLLN